MFVNTFKFPFEKEHLFTFITRQTHVATPRQIMIKTFIRCSLQISKSFFSRITVNNLTILTNYVRSTNFFWLIP